MTAKNNNVKEHATKASSNELKQRVAAHKKDLQLEKPDELTTDLENHQLKLKSEIIPQVY